MSTILAALRRAEQERRRQPVAEPRFPHLPAGALLSTEPAALLPFWPRLRRYARRLQWGGALLLGAALMWLWLYQTPLDISSPIMRSPEVRLSGAPQTAAVQAVALQTIEAQATEPPTLAEPQVVSFPRLETERISAEQLSTMSALPTEAAVWAMPSPIAGIAAEDNLISADDILPTPPLPTDPVRRPGLATADVAKSVAASAETGRDTSLSPPAKLDLRGVSPELAQAFRQALQDKSAAASETVLAPLPQQPPALTLAPLSATAASATTASAATASAAKVLPQLRHLPAARRALVPTLHFEVHNYVSAPDKRWVRLNGQVYRSGAQLAKGVKLVRIEPEQIVLAVKGQEAALPALQDWSAVGG